MESGLKVVLQKHRKIGIDTSVFIYHFEAHPIYLPLTTEILELIHSGKLTACTSIITLMEIAVKPLMADQPDVADEYEILIKHFPNLSIFDVNDRIAREAAKLRAKYRLKPPDALQVATALQAKATLFVTNDSQLKQIKEKDLEVALLDDFL